MAVYTAGPRLLPYLEDIHGLSAGDLGAGSGGRHLIVSVGGSSKSGRPPWGLTPRAPVRGGSTAGRWWVEPEGDWAMDVDSRRPLQR